MYIIAKKLLKIIEYFHNGSFFIICFLQEPLGILEMLHESILNHLWKCFPISLCCNYTYGWLSISLQPHCLLFFNSSCIFRFPRFLSIWLIHRSIALTPSITLWLAWPLFSLLLLFSLIHLICHINKTVFSLLFVFLDYRIV